MHSNIAVILSAMYILCAGAFMAVALGMIHQDSTSITRRVYFVELTLMAVWSLFIGLMTVSNGLDAAKTYWALAFFGSFLFFPVWLHVQLSWEAVGARLMKKMIYVFEAASIVLGILCIVLGKPELKFTALGVQYSYQGSPIFQIATLYSTILLLLSAVYNLKWLLSTKFRRERRTAMIFFVLMLILAPIGFFADFIYPTFFGFTIVPLACPIVLILTIQFQYSLRLNHIFNVSIQGVSELVFRTAAMPVLVLNYKNIIVLTNDYANTCFLESKKLIGADIRELLDLSGIDNFDEAFSDNFENRRVNMEVGGETRNYDMQLSVMKDEYGDIYKKILILKDVTEIQKANDISKLQKEISMAVSTNSNFRDKLSEAFDLAGKFLSIERLTAYELKSSEEEDYFECLLQWNAKDSVGMQPVLKKAPMSFVQAEYEELAKIGYVKHVDLRQGSSPFAKYLMEVGYKSFLIIPLMEEKRLLGIVFVGSVSSYRNWTQAEINLVQSIADIMVTALSREHMQSEIIAERDNASAASLAKSEFLSRMSHEIRTPMNAIIGMTTIAQTTNDNARIQYCLNKISEASRHLLGLINDVLDMSKIEANKLELIEEPFDFEKTLENICNVITVKADEKKINLFITIDPEVPTDVIGDELRLSQVITNLLSNAIKFTPDHGNIDLNISLKEILSENESILYVEVVDNGIGISPDQQRKLFKSFEQAEGNITRRFGGTGLGLVISKRIVELMDGEIGVTSEINNGSRFFFTIKIKHDRKSAEQNQPTYKGRRILVVDNDNDVLAYFDRVLTNFEMIFDCASTGESAIEFVKSSIVENKPYDIIFVDYLMNGIDGIETVRKIKNIAGESIHVIMISTAEWSKIEKEATEVDVAGFISKPLFSSSILNIINRLVINKNELEKVKEDIPQTIPTFSRCRLLLVEDIEINKEIAIALLEETQIAVDCAENGEVALAMFKDNQEKYDIIFMDMQMPVMDGLEATKQIRALGTAKAKTIPIIAMTANAFKEDVEACKNAGMNNHLGKPVSVDALINMVSNYLKGKEDSVVSMN